MRLLAKLAAAGACGMLLLQLMRPAITSGPAIAEIQAPQQVRQTLEKDCYSCHSNERRLAWFDEIVPAYWLVRQDVLNAREHLNFSTLGAKPVGAQKAALYEAVNMIQLGAMPLPQYTALHHEARVTPEELAVLKAYLAPWKVAESGTSLQAAGFHVRADSTKVPAESNGLAFEQSFENWKAISFTDRGDNKTLRMILGNDIAVRAARSGQISPWPDGSRFAKIAWQQATGSDGLIYPGKFVQVEFMVKDAKLYKDSEGWGWGRWRGDNLQPYGANSNFVKECTGCDLPMRGDDFVYTLPISNAKTERSEVVNSRAAALPSNPPYQPLAWNVLTMYVDPRAHTMAALFGNDVALRRARANDSERKEATHAGAGASFALVTWAQREDPHWFGGRIPDSPESVEFVEETASGTVTSFHRYEGADLHEIHLPADIAARQIKFISTLAPAWQP